jgi:hypothetical protein
MKSATVLPWAVLVLVLGGQPVAAEPPQTAPPCCTTRECSIPLLRGCPDDYCRKPLPVSPCLSCGVPDDYGRKPCPRTLQMHLCGGVDDYNRKPCPSSCRPMSTSHYTCGSHCLTAGKQQSWQDTPPLGRLEGNSDRPDQGSNRGVAPPGTGATGGRTPLSPYHPR